ncbi:MAG: PAC2 family protein [Chloroflexi bacterium]|nr:PAC2 family protein [Chloroflexota bacterium]MBL7061542.1 PAC2 family protein [Dehalococcoidia bacterium]
MRGAVKLYKEPRLKSCDLIAAWPGIGNVALIVAKYIKDKLNAEEIGEIEPFDFFDPIGIMVKGNIIEAPQFPESKFYHWHNSISGRDLILFISDEQPSFKGYELASSVLDVSRKLKVKRVYTCAAAIARIHHAEKPKVWGAATSQKLLEILRKYDVILRGDIQIAGLNGLFLGVAKEMGFEGICLLGEVPMYTTRIPNPKASLAVLDILTKMLDININLSELAKVAKESDEEMTKLAAEAMGEFIDRYTKPVWPPEEEIEEEEGEEGEGGDEEEN